MSAGKALDTSRSNSVASRVPSMTRLLRTRPGGRPRALSVLRRRSPPRGNTKGRRRGALAMGPAFHPGPIVTRNEQGVCRVADVVKSGAWSAAGRRGRAAVPKRSAGSPYLVQEESGRRRQPRHVRAHDLPALGGTHPRLALPSLAP